MCNMWTLHEKINCPGRTDWSNWSSTAVLALLPDNMAIPGLPLNKGFPSQGAMERQWKNNIKQDINQWIFHWVWGCLCSLFTPSLANPLPMPAPDSQNHCASSVAGTEAACCMRKGDSHAEGTIHMWVTNSL